jgi:hypothetical protein
MKSIWQAIHNPPKSRILKLEAQIKAWQKAGRKMKWEIDRPAFETIGPIPELSEADRRAGFSGVILSYGFGDDGCGHCDPVLSGRLAWEYALKKRRVKSWQCQYIDFADASHFRLRPKAPPRPKGFYFAKFREGEICSDLTVARFRKGLDKQDTGCGPEGIQLLTITHPHLARLMNRREILFMAFADYDVAPYGFYDFFDALQMFCSNDTLGLGIGNVDRNYAGFGIPTLRF